MVMPMVVVPAAVMPVMMPMMMVMPVHLRRHLRVFLDRRRGAGIDQRYCLRALDRCAQQQECADCRKPENFRSAHSSLLRFTGCHVSAVYGCTPNRLVPDAT